MHPDDNVLQTRSRADRVRLLAFAALMLAAGWGLAVAAGPPRLPQHAPGWEDILKVLAGASLPLDGLLLVLVDAAWALWAWIILSLSLQSLLAAADLVARGGSQRVRALRGVVDRASVPLVRRGVAAAFAVQVISRGMPIASAQALQPVETVVVAAANSDAESVAPASRAPDATPTYLVRPGDTLWSIAEQAYGSGAEYRRLVNANVGRQMPDGQVFSARGVIRPGWQLVVPGATWHVEVIEGERWYTVAPGDTLSSIADSTLGDPRRWSELFDLNRGIATDDGKHVLLDANMIWPGLRLHLPDSPADGDQAQTPDPPETPEPESAPTELSAASATLSVADPSFEEAPATPASQTAVPDPDPEPVATPPAPPPLLRTRHAFQPVALDPADAPQPADIATPASAAADVVAPASAVDTQVSLPAPPWRSDLPALPLAIGGLGLVGAAGLMFGARRLRRLRPLPQEPESEIVVSGGFAEAQLAHDLTRGLHGIGFDPVAALVDQVQRFLAESSLADSTSLAVLAVRYGRSSTTITFRCGLAEQPILLELASAFAQALQAEVEACVSSDQDVIWRLVRLRKTRLLPSAEFVADAPCLVPLGVLYDRQVYSVAWASLGHVLVASLPGHGADTILTSLVATLTSRRSPAELRIWLIAAPRSLPAPLFDLPHVARVVDPTDEAALLLAADELRAELDRRTNHTPPGPDLLVVVPELSTLGQHADRFALLAGRGLDLGVRFVAASSEPERTIDHPLATHLATRLVLRMQTEEASVALLGVADATFLGGGGRLLLRLDGREPVELYGYQVSGEHLERLVKVMRSADVSASSPNVEQRPRPEPPREPPDEGPSTDALLLAPEPPRDTDAPSASEPPRSIADTAGASDTDAVEIAQVPIQVFCFGTPSVVCAGQTVWPRNGGDAKPWELLLFLASQPIEGVSKSAVISALWPREEMVEDLAHRLRQLRFRLRRQLQQVPGSPQVDGISLDRRMLRVDPGIMHSDAQEFLALVHSVRVNPGGDAIERLEQARALYVGDLLTGPDVRRYAWLDERDDSGVTLREHFRRLFENASVRLAELYTEANDLEAAIDVYREITDVDPADERLWQALFRLHARRGDRDALVAEEQRLRQTLRELAEELEAPDDARADEPGLELVQEYQQLLAGLRAREPAPV
jgi:nucleoid-associated protein YgaU/two-component SAPR family response regulator